MAMDAAVWVSIDVGQDVVCTNLIQSKDSVSTNFLEKLIFVIAFTGMQALRSVRQVYTLCEPVYNRVLPEDFFTRRVTTPDLTTCRF